MCSGDSGKGYQEKEGIAHAPRRTTSHENGVIFKGEHIDRGGLAGSVRAQETEDLPLKHRENDLIYGQDILELLGQAVNLDDIHSSTTADSLAFLVRSGPVFPGFYDIMIWNFRGKEFPKKRISHR
ncbi:hypothetical protein HKBW3S34_02363 [Candidatus Hakubella thermalkaliphila]|uniref:Uncharacterized protein n=2 Tax=Candidatus Hakubella thermalkaliphila TaxID=2754717 RepID=A0A6V8PGJ0_9ACTN|nr:hypothetical protein HKBW3S34_02363 [Candidatus Hakubella thermalkaliphila]